MPFAEIEADLTPDARWQLIERIIHTEPFQKSTRLPALLRYLAQCTIAGNQEDLTEQKIGNAVFGKPTHYNPAEDSSVRVHMRQLRLRLHEYYDSEERNEALVVKIPKGRYALIFDPALQSLQGQSQAVEPSQQPAVRSNNTALQIFLGLLIALAAFCSAGWYRASISAHPSPPPWPLSLVIQDNIQTTVVLADVGYTLRMLSDKQVPLDQYIDRSYLNYVVPQKMDEGESHLVHYLEVSQTTSIADVHAAMTISKLSGPDVDNIVIRSARDLNSHDLDSGNYIFVGAKTSNPWTALFEDRLNFKFVEDHSNDSRYIVNANPRPGELTIYKTPGWTGSSGEDFATIAVLPSKNGGGTILLLQGLRLEGTEAAIRVLATETRDSLKNRLASANGNIVPKYFEALIRAQSVAGAPISIDIVAIRVIQP